jgi:hypothetical protein
MTADEAIAVFSAYSPGEKAEFLAGLIYELTIIAREGYEFDGEGLINPYHVRRANELQHRLSAFLWALLREDPKRYPDEFIVRLALEQPDDPAFGRKLSEAFARLAARRLTAA